VIVTTILAFLLAFSPITALAAPVAQFGSLLNNNEEQAGEQLLLGEYAFVDMLNGESYSVEVVIPESGSYLVTAVDDVAAEDFDLIVTDSAGNELFNDIFATTDLALESGTVTLTFIAVADNTLGVVVLGQIGGMTADQNQPGKLIPGSIYINDEINGTLYATLSIPPSTYPRQVLVAFEPREEDVFYAYATGEDVYAYASTDTTDILRFWSHGGDYELEVSAYERRSQLTMVVFVTGQPTSLAVGDTVEGVLPAGATEVVYELELDANYTGLELTTSSDENLGVTVLDNYYDYDVYFSSYGEAELLVDSIYPGVYYVVVQASEAAAADIPFSLTLNGEAGRQTVALELGTAFEDVFIGGENSANYSFEVANPGAIVTVNLTSGDENTDLDLTAGLRPGGTNWSAYSWGQEETLTFLAPIAGTYYVSVLSNGNTGPFTVQVEEGDPAPTLQTNAVFYDVVEGYTRNVYLLPITEAGQLLSVILVGPENADLDLSVNGYNSSGDHILSLSGYSSGSAEAVSYLLPEAGLYEVGVSANYSEQGGYFFIQAQVIDPLTFGSQWATDATASSVYGEDGYSALQATGPSDTPSAGDYSTAWASQDPDAGVETLELTYAVPVRPTAIAIYESYNPGAITTIEAFDSENNEWVVLYEGEAGPVEEAYRIFMPELTPVSFTTDQIRLTLDTSLVPSWNEIDAVQLFGRP
jgi:hypothetical protein